MSDTVIRVAGELRAALGGASTSSGVNTIRDRLDAVDRLWLAGCPLWFLGTVGDVSPRGDEPGAVLVLDDTTVVLPERAGNRRGDGYANLLRHREVGLCFVIPGRLDTLRINGTADMISDAEWFGRLTLNGVRPPLALRVTVEEVFYHCVQGFRRAHVWEPDYWTPDAAPSRREVAAALACELPEEAARVP